MEANQLLSKRHFSRDAFLWALKEADSVPLTCKGGSTFNRVCFSKDQVQILWTKS
jgi:hypothetical protein